MRRSRLIGADSLPWRIVLCWLIAAVLAATAATAAAAEAPECATVRFSDVGWTDITATTALAGRLLESLGYRTTTQILSIPVTYASLKSRQIDVYLGDWEPSIRADRAPFLADGSIEVVRANLEGAKYTLAVPDYVAAAGVASFADLRRFADRFGRKIYAIEPGNDGNRLIAALIGGDRFGLGGWTMVESSEQGMLSQVGRAERRRDWVVFLGWSPHPMNLRYRLRYLAGGEDSFGPNDGGATVFTDTRAGYLRQCPNVAALLRHLVFTPEIESRLMSLILDEQVEPRAAAQRFLQANPALLSGWLEGVTTRAGLPGIDAARRDLSAVPGVLPAGLAAADAWVSGHKIPLGAVLAGTLGYATHHAQGFFDRVSAGLGGLIAALTGALAAIPPLLLIALIAAAAYGLQRRVALTVFVLAALLLIDNQGLWRPTVQTLSLVLFSTVVCMLCGIPVGIAAAHRAWLQRLLQPLLDLMQTIPTFVYLIPTLLLFGLGVVPGLISTVIFAVPAPIRLTQLGISSVPRELRDVGAAFGATPRQVLFKIELPHALPTIMAGITQSIMLRLSMVVIAALVGAEGLGTPVVRALNSVNAAMGFEAGIAIVIVAIVLDRLFRRRA